MRPRALVEACVDTAELASAAEASGADRLELCGPGEGGLTPPRELLELVMRRSRVPVHAMIRPREGDFCYTSDEFEAMRRDVVAVREAGAQGAVFGVLRADATLDVDRMRVLVDLARPMRVACHRAFDRTPDPDAALDELMALGVDLVLTSGHARTATEGAEVLARHVRRAGNRITILGGGSIRAGNARALLQATGLGEVHARATDTEAFAALVREVASLDQPPEPT
ncbi:MAG TPA: copper homeostasis protein CutC [Gemmatimonadaceae bacterium]|nr:copper homeostasis protein CutC [Gemmatimonadaceae bacterium]